MSHSIGHRVLSYMLPIGEHGFWHGVHALMKLRAEG